MWLSGGNIDTLKMARNHLKSGIEVLNSMDLYGFVCFLRGLTFAAIIFHDCMVVFWKSLYAIGRTSVYKLVLGNPRFWRGKAGEQADAKGPGKA